MSLLIALLRFLSLLAAPCAQALLWRTYGGYLPAGDDIATLPGGTTIAAAEAFCASASGCVGFTFDGPKAGPVPSGGTCYFKNSSALDGFVPNATSPWTTFLVIVGPCDIYGAAGTPCVAAHSVARALFSAYTGPLYQVNRTSDGALLDVGLRADSGGAADADAQDAFCGAAPCVIQRIYDQSPRGNHLSIAPPGGAYNRQDLPVNASRWPTTLGGSRVYAAYFEGGGQGYRIDNTSGVATANDPETLYMITDGTHVNGGCCFDYGNAETDNHDDGAGTMESVYWGTCSIWGHGDGEGPWVMADLENGLWAGNVRANPDNAPLRYPFVMAMVKGGTDGFALKAGDATQGKLMLMYDGPRPDGYQPMKKQGAIILGIGGDNSASAVGTFFEGVITSGYTSDEADDAVHRNVVAALYGA